MKNNKEAYSEAAEVKENIAAEAGGSLSDEMLEDVSGGVIIQIPIYPRA
ncbi:MAG: hypothetical protein LIO87_10940 [Eubacterium sp.]|nr:hypothetical protein [Eubacterium sp.]